MLNRRELLILLAAGAVVPPLRKGGLGGVAAAKAKDYPIHKAKVEPLWKSPDGHANALEATHEGLWVGEQVTDIAYLLDWESGKVLRKVPTESSNTSGMAYGGGFLWMAANGPANGRETRPTDAKTGEVIKIDAQTGKTAHRYPIPGGGGVHGLTWAENSLWITTLRRKSLTQVDGNFKILYSIPVTLSRAHGLAWDDDSIWCVFSNDMVIQRLDAKDGHIREAVQLSRSDPELHGMTRYKDTFYYCNAGIGPKDRKATQTYPGYICRLHL